MLSARVRRGEEEWGESASPDQFERASEPE